MKPIIQVVLFISSTQHRERKCYFTVFFFFYYKVSVWKLPIKVERENIFCREVDGVKNNNLEDVTVEQLQAEARCIV